MAEKGAAAVADDTGTAAGTAGADGAGKKTDDAAAGKTGDAAATGDGGKKPDGAAGSEPGSKAGQATPEPKAPEKYDLKLPDGGRIDAEELTHFEKIARSQNWTNDKAQQAINDHATALESQSQRFLEATKADPDYGGDKLADTQKLARAVLDRVRPAGTPRGDALRQLLDKSGYGNNLEVISFLADLGRMTAEDSATGGTRTTAGSRDPASVLYGGTKT